MLLAVSSIRRLLLLQLCLPFWCPPFSLYASRSDNNRHKMKYTVTKLPIFSSGFMWFGYYKTCIPKLHLSLNEAISAQPHFFLCVRKAVGPMSSRTRVLCSTDTGFFFDISAITVSTNMPETRSCPNATCCIHTTKVSSVIDYRIDNKAPIRHVCKTVTLHQTKNQ